MNYQLIYDNIIHCAKSRTLDPAVHYDIHHILPKSMGGTNDHVNLVNLTDKEHFIAHTLLWKIHRNRSMTSALWIMSQNKRYHYKEMNSNRYAALREEFRAQQTNQQIYKFENIITGEIFEGIRKKFREYANISYSECAAIVNRGFIYKLNNDLHSNGVNWKLHGCEVKRRIPHNSDCVAYNFVNIHTNTLFTGTRLGFKNTFNLQPEPIINHNKIINGWTLLTSDNCNKYQPNSSREYKFINIDTGKIFTGTCIQFKKLTNITFSHIHLTGKIAPLKRRWRLYDRPVTSCLSIARLTVHTFINVDTGETYTGTAAQFSKLTGINPGNLVRKRNKIMNSWKITASILPGYVH